jgi:hypothetical protein
MRRRRRVVGENQDESKWPLKRRRTRHGTQRKPSMEECDGCCYHCLTRIATDNSAYYRTRVDSDKRDDLDHQSNIQSSPSSRAAVITAHLLLALLALLALLLALLLLAFILLALLLGARRCRVCDTRVSLLSELPTTAAYLYPNSKTYEASLSFESPPRAERCIEVFEYLPPLLLLLPSFHLTPSKWKKSQETNRGSWKPHLTLSTYRRGVK